MTVLPQDPFAFDFDLLGDVFDLVDEPQGTPIPPRERDAHEADDAQDMAALVQALSQSGPTPPATAQPEMASSDTRDAPPMRAGMNPDGRDQSPDMSDATGLGIQTLTTDGDAPGPVAAEPTGIGLLGGWGFWWSLPDPAPEPEPVSASFAVPWTAAEFTGSGKAVVVIDDGYSPYYDQSNTVFGYDFSGWNDSNARVNTIDSHGSWVAQVVTNVASEVDIIHLKVFGDGAGGASMRDIEEALQWTVWASGSFDIAAVNMSLGFGATKSKTKTVLSNEIAALSNAGIFTVVAAGNDGKWAPGINILAADPNAIAVSATKASGKLAGFSQANKKLTDIAALGKNVEVETVWGATGKLDGTSFAAPVVSGAAARLQDAATTTLGRQLTEDEFLGILRKSGDSIVGAPKAPGYKIADADAAVEYFLDNLDQYDTPLVA